MSNLSELLPTGGGQNAVDFVATGTLASGQTVALKTDGTVEAITGVTEGAGTPVVFEAYAQYMIGMAFDSNANKIVIAFRDDTNSNYGTAVVGTVSGTSISFGSKVVFYSGLTQEIAATFDSSSNKIVIAFNFSNGNGRAVVGTVSGTTISFGSSASFSSTDSRNISAAFDSTNNKVVIAYKNKGNSNYGTAVVGTVSGTSISFGSAAVFESAFTDYISAAYDSTNNKVVIAYRDGNNSNYGTAIVGTVSGTSISFGAAVVFAAYSTYISAAYDSTNNKVVIAYRDIQIASSYGTAIVGTVSGTSISFGTAVVFNNAITDHISAVYDSNVNKVVIAYDEGNSSTGNTIVGTVSGTSITFGTAAVFDNSEPRNTVTVFDSTSNKVVIAYADYGGDLRYGTSVVFTVGSSNNTSFIGITSKAISSGATGAINTYGGINAVQTGLTIASDYYVQADGSLSTTTSTVKAGQAISATTINLKDLT